MGAVCVQWKVIRAVCLPAFCRTTRRHSCRTQCGIPGTETAPHGHTEPREAGSLGGFMTCTESWDRNPAGIEVSGSQSFGTMWQNLVQMWKAKK